VSDISDDDDGRIDDLQEWAVKNNVSHIALGDLLTILKRRYPELPKDARTVMQTCTSVQLQAVAGGSYHHFGLVDGFKSVIDKFGVSDNVISLQLNIDGLLLFRSSTAQFWPILGLATNCFVKEPFIVGLFYGNSKPSSATEYLNDLVQECCAVQQDGFWHNDNRHSIQLTAVVCDTPARSFVKVVKGHAGYHGCDKCVQEGVYASSRMSFPETRAARRTDESFNAQSDDSHHL